MKNLNLLVWLTQLGMSVALPLAGFVLLGVWLHRSCGWGAWTVWAGIGLGLYSAVEGLMVSLKAMGQMEGRGKKNDPSPVSFNDHD